MEENLIALTLIVTKTHQILFRWNILCISAFETFIEIYQTPLTDPTYLKTNKTSTMQSCEDKNHSSHHPKLRHFIWFKCWFINTHRRKWKVEKDLTARLKVKYSEDWCEAFEELRTISLRWHSPGWDVQLFLYVQYCSIWGFWALSSPCPHHLLESPAGELMLLIKLITAAVGGMAAMFSGTAQAQHHAGALSVSEGSFSWMILHILPTWALSTWETKQECETKKTSLYKGRFTEGTDNTH